MGRLDIIDLILKERHRQNTLKAEGKFPYTCADPELTDSERVVILTEEIGEVCRAVHDHLDENKKEELIQVAAIVLAWLEHEYGVSP